MSNEKIKVGFVPVMADLYNRLAPKLRGELADFCGTVKSYINTNTNLKFETSPVCCIKAEINQAIKDLEQNGFHLLVLGMVSYTPSGQIIEPLNDTKLPLLVWPAQPMLKLDPQKYDASTVMFNHGVHGAMDLCNVLIKKGRNFGVLHGHYQQDSALNELVEWARAGKAVSDMKNSNPANIGGHFEDMLDLRIGDDKFINKLGVKKCLISTAEFVNSAASISERKIADRVRFIRSKYEINEGLSNELLTKAVRHELAVRELLKKNNSQAVGINFMTLCNNPDISDALHLAACTLMEDGFGYAGEGDWVTAMLMRGMLSAGFDASFSEVFSVGYLDNRLVLRHWGEGNPLLARSKPILRASCCNDRNKAEFVVMDFEFAPGAATLVNLNSDSNGQGQIICIQGEIEDTRMPAVDGPRAVFNPHRPDVRELLTSYAYNGGSHHLVLVRGDCRNIVGRISKLTGWKAVEV
jgi:L-arabinose isomerase